MFIDEITITAKAGNGGDGVVRWRREKYRPKGGPGGGNGGRGGDVIAEAVSDLSYLETYRHQKKFKAQNGEPGANFGIEGANGKPLILKFPVGSILTNKETGETWELDEIGEQVQILRGGRGGLGNEHFKSSTNTTPYEWTPGREGQEATIEIELQLTADIGLVGLPSAGKSTLLNMLTNAKSKVGAYDFTTLEPHLGVLPSGQIMADIPGLIEGASEGKGLGYKFLRHIRRTQALAHVVSCDRADVVATYQGIRKELQAFDPMLLDKPEIIILSKTDTVEPEVVRKHITALQKVAGGQGVIAVTAYDEKDMQRLQKALQDLL